MKKIVAIALVIVMAFTLGLVTACKNEPVTIRVTVYETPNSQPRVCKHVIGQDDLPTVTNGDLVFDGWYYDSKYTQPFNPTTDEDIVDGTVLYAKWKQGSSATDEKVTLILNYNYTGAELKMEKLNKGNSYNLPTPTQNGYTFEGWYDQATGGTKYTSSTPINEDTTLYAHWTQNAQPIENVTLTLNLNYAGGQTTTVTVTKGSTYNFTTPTRSGYTFEGWYDQASGGTKYTSSTPINANTTLYAHWTENSQGSDESVKEQFLTSVVSQPVDGGEYYVAMYYALPNKVYYGTAQTDTTKLISTEDKSSAAVATIEKTSGGFYIKLGTQYLSLGASGTKVAVKLTSSASTVFTVGENDILIATYNSKEYTLGSYQSGTNTQLYTYFGASEAKFSTGDNADKVDDTQFPVRLVTLDGSSAPFYTISVDTSKPLIVEVGAQIDYASYFTITDKDGESVAVTNGMLDLSAADTTQEGTFAVTITYENASAQIIFAVVATGTDITTNPEELDEVFANYADDSNWNFAVDITYGDANEEYGDYYEYLGDMILNTYTYGGNEYTEYLAYEDGTAYWYYDNGDGTYELISENSSDFEEYFAMMLIDLTQLGDYVFVKVGDCYVAVNANEAAGAVLGQAENNSWTSFVVYIANGNITKLIATMDDGWTYTFTFSKHGQVSFTLPNVSGGDEGDDPLPTEPTGTMDNQVYDEATFDNKNLQNKIEDSEDYIGLPSTGTYNALVIPVQFQNDNITSAQLTKLEKAFNGSSSDTGWESVKTYYQKSSYGKLNLTFDIMGVYQAKQNANYYKNYNGTYTIDGKSYTKDGSMLILEEALAYYESRIDLTKYDHNNDGCIDAVYLIYSESVDYTNADFYWAYVTWYGDDNAYDGLYPYYYLFAGFDFMDENLDKMPGVKVNAETYIHETGHLLGLDDYYDYDTKKGSNLGLGGADMMDYNVGDHGVYSKIMLGWLTPQIITSSQTVTISSSQDGGYAILIPLNWNNSYFCEYLLIDLYTATGLNEMGASQQNTILYGGAQYGVRIYHVSSSINNPYNDSYGSFTDNNNSVSSIPLIKLIEADGQTSKSSKGSWASASDLWQAGDSLSNVFPQYMRNDGKLLNFNITIDSVSSDSATITITYANAA